MGAIDYITVVIGPPEAQEEKDKFSALAEESGRSIEEVYIELAPQLMEKFGERKAGGQSVWDQLFSGALGQPVSIDSPRVTYFEKKTEKSPALMFPAATLVDGTGNSVRDLATEILRNIDNREALALEFGKALGLHWVRVFVTFG